MKKNDTNYQSFFKGKKITVLGLGLLGRGVGDCAFLAEQGAELIVTDLKTEQELASSVEQLKKYPNITFRLGEHRLEDFRNRDFILKAAGVPLDSPYIAEARKNGIPIEMSTALFAAFTPATVIGVTGTRGKSTVTHLLFTILEKAFAGTAHNVFIGGNVKGVSTLALLPQTKAEDYVVLELDSWQLQGFAERGISPQVAVFTTFMTDHMNYYHNDMAAYFNDKAALYHNQKTSDVLVISDQVMVSGYFDQKKNGQMIIVGSKDFPSIWTCQMPGEHNILNAALARAAAQAVGVTDEIIRSVIETFKGVPGRLEFIRTLNDVAFYNDTNATTPQATIAALKALSQGKNIVLIMGGADKQVDMTELVKMFPTYVYHVVMLPGTGTERVKQDIEKTRVPISYVNSMAGAVTKAVEIAQSGQIILLSPGFASFGLFKNEFDRGDQFVTIVRSL